MAKKKPKKSAPEPMGSSPVNTGRQTITGLSTAKSLTVPAGTDWVLVQALTQNVRVTFDGTTTPTASVGVRLVAGKAIRVRGLKLASLQFIEETASASLEVAYFGGSAPATEINIIG